MQASHSHDDRLQMKWKDLAILNGVMRSSVNRRKETQDITSILKDLKCLIEAENGGSR